MSNIEFKCANAIPSFSALKMKQEIQAEIIKETKGMTQEEVREYIRQGAEQYNRYLADRRSELSKQ